MAFIQKVLIIDDDSTIRENFKKELEAFGVEVLTTDNAKEGIQIIEQEKPVVTFVDLLMPGMSGDEMLVKVSEKKLFHCSSFYLYTDKELNSTDTFKLMTLGFTHIFKMPLDRDQLLSILVTEDAILSPSQAA